MGADEEAIKQARARHVEFARREKEQELYYQRQAHDLTNLLFNKGFLNDALDRESIDWLEDYLTFVLQSQGESAAKAALLTASMRDKH